MTSIDRRSFLGTAAAVTAASSVRVWSQERKKTRLALLGSGWFGVVDAKAALEVGGVEFVAICDVDTAHLSNAAAEIGEIQGLKPQTFQNYEELLDRVELDAVIIATPPHWHALMFIEACRRGLDIYCEKPLSYDIREGQAMVLAAKEAGNVVQIGFQRRQADSVAEATEFLRQGKAGTIRQVEAQIHYEADLRDTTVQEPPASLDWDQWCGPAPRLPYRPNIGHIAWRLEKEYGHGHLVDWGIHWIDGVRNMLHLGIPRHVQASGGRVYFRDEITTPDTMVVHFDFDRCPLVWRHRIWGAAEYTPRVSNGMFFYGDEATVFVGDHRWEVIPKAPGAEPIVHEARPERDLVVRHMEEFLQARARNESPNCTVEDGFQSTAAVQLAMISLETNSRISWDRENHGIRGNPEAARLLKRDYRDPWEHPYQS